MSTFFCPPGRDANLSQSKIWRLSFFSLTQLPEFQRTPPPHDKLTQPPMGMTQDNIFEVLHEVHTMKICNHHFDDRNNLCQWLVICAKMPQKPYWE